MSNFSVGLYGLCETIQEPNRGNKKRVSSESKTRREPKIIYFPPDIQESQWTVIQLSQMGNKKKKGEKKKVMFVGCYKKNVSNDILDMNDVNDIFIISDMTTV